MMNDRNIGQKKNSWIIKIKLGFLNFKKTDIWIPYVGESLAVAMLQK